LRAGCFELRNWLSHKLSTNSQIPSTHLSSNKLNFRSNENAKTFGLPNLVLQGVCTHIIILLIALLKEQYCQKFLKFLISRDYLVFVVPWLNFDAIYLVFSMLEMFVCSVYRKYRPLQQRECIFY
jgi:hypothetical protein